VFEFHGTEEHPESWLYGLNVNTREHGYMPAQCVRFVDYFANTRYNMRASVEPALPTLQENQHHHQASNNYIGVTINNPVKTRSNTMMSQSSSFDSTSQTGTSDDLSEQPWYWGKVSKEEVNRVLQNEKDGTFLVRDANQPAGCYTLTLRKDRTNKLIKIYYDQHGKYGFSHPYNFASVTQLINYFRKESLAAYNVELDIRLMYPANRPMITSDRQDDLLKELVEDDKELTKKKEDYEKLTQRYQEMQKNVRQCKSSIESFKITLDLLQESVKVLEENKNKNHQDDQRIFKNSRTKSTRITQVRKLLQENERNLSGLKAREEEQNERMMTLKEEIVYLKHRRDSTVEYLRSNNVSDQEINKALNINVQGENIYQMLEVQNLRQKFPKHVVENNWYFPNFTRDNANHHLRGKPNGTFLIRNRNSNKGGPKHACSLVANGETHHCLIMDTKEGFGFAEPFNLHSSLVDLVLHYADNELTPHNETLNTKLEYPLLST